MPLAPDLNALTIGVRTALLRLPAATWPELPAAATPPPGGNATQLSESIPLLARLLAEALGHRPAPFPLSLKANLPEPEANLPEPAATARRSGPPSPGAPVAPPLLASALAEAVSRSGVFYESHLAQWVSGARETVPVLLEAQARLQTLPAVPEAAGEVAMRQQLASLATGELAFQFAPWLGQEATLAIRREPEPAPSPVADRGRDIVAHLDLAMPGLGAVRATLTLNPRGIDIEVNAASASGARALQAARDTLAQALAAAQLQAGRIEVSHERR